jgi:hypothetical protein
MMRYRKAGVDKLITDYPQILNELNLQETLSQSRAQERT